MAKRSEVLEFIRFCAKHGVEVNKETIWQRVKEHRRVRDAVKNRLGGRELLTSSKPSSEQLKLNLPKPERI